MARARPFFVREIREKHADKQVEVWVQDEARFGQQGTLTTVWADRGSRPTAVKQTEYDWIYLFAAVNPLTGESSALLAPTVNTDYMNAHLAFISRHAGPNKHVVLVLDQAGWHVARGLKIPENITLLHLPPYSPELNPTERVWDYLKSHYLSNRVFTDYDDLLSACRNAWNSLADERLQTICRTEWIMHEVEA
jgi:transposase